MALSTWIPNLRCGRSIRPEDVTAPLHNGSAPVLQTESGRSIRPGATICARRHLVMAPARHAGSEQFDSARAHSSRRVASGEALGLSSQGRRGQHPHAPPVCSRGPKDGHQITDLAYAGSSPAGSITLRCPLGRSEPSKLMGGRFDPCTAHHLGSAARRTCIGVRSRGLRVRFPPGPPRARSPIGRRHRPQTRTV